MGLSGRSNSMLTVDDRTGPDFAGAWGPGANIEDGSSLIIHWNSGSHKRSTNWAIINTTFILVGGPYTGGGTEPRAPWTSLNPALRSQLAVVRSGNDLVFLCQIRRYSAVQCFKHQQLYSLLDRLPQNWRDVLISLHNCNQMLHSILNGLYRRRDKLSVMPYKSELQ